MAQYYEDLKVGDTFETTYQTITKDEIIEFASKYDPQPFHLNTESATESIFGELVASGYHTLSISINLFTKEHLVTDEGIAIMAGKGIDNLRFHQPVTPGDQLTTSVEIIDKYPSDSRSDRGYIDLGHTTENDSGETVLSMISYGIVSRC